MSTLTRTQTDLTCDSASRSSQDIREALGHTQDLRDALRDPHGLSRLPCLSRLALGGSKSHLPDVLSRCAHVDRATSPIRHCPRPVPNETSEREDVTSPDGSQGAVQQHHPSKVLSHTCVII